ncbi:DUF6456 domain-containing protein [Palleronia caenipelagi]|uniref:Helix-turn-helix domain-containing protein n=1 Tax=Palleronia caenipelagi TaxID=2489174 RepID=A0A547PQL7_9RHOB|nr:DUF6456 domain-containing protein [Palleronia caenipelagi]TRD16417.1 helix-turn-helix domain-containing protein [Palleronia caenipelagi]
MRFAPEIDANWVYSGDEAPGLRRIVQLPEAALQVASSASAVVRNPCYKMGTDQINAITKEKAIDVPVTPSALNIVELLDHVKTYLAVAPGMETAVVVRDLSGGDVERLASIDHRVVESMRDKHLIVAEKTGLILRYRLSPQGQAYLNGSGAPTEEADEGSHPRAISETPLAMLARRKDKTGGPFLSPDLVKAGERLYEDAELVRITAAGGRSWEALLEEVVAGTPPRPDLTAAETRLRLALIELGPGLADVCLRVCGDCDGLESVERRMGWAARSGKIVLRIGLQSLARHYRVQGQGGDLLG